jgi:hypothetical protein
VPRQGKAGLVKRKPVPRNPANRTPPEIVEKVLHLRRTYHLGPIRIVWYLARYHDIKISDAGGYRILRRNDLNRLPRGTRVRKIHTQRYEQKVPGHQILVDVNFLIFQGKAGKTIKRRKVSTGGGRNLFINFQVVTKITVLLVNRL